MDLRFGIGAEGFRLIGLRVLSWDLRFGIEAEGFRMIGLRVLSWPLDLGLKVKSDRKVRKVGEASNFM